ncbi:MAG: class I SAM-dependent methyltransferase [Candidatus Krumholzibacteriia bacterium]
MPNRQGLQAGDTVQAEKISLEVAKFYDRLVFPSRSSHFRYREFLPERPGERVGDFGCGQSIFHDALREYAPPPTFLDISRNVLGTIDRGNRICADLRHLPFRDATYDRILCIGVVHHLPERSTALREMARVLVPGARLFLGVYAPRTLNARLRRLHDALPYRPWQGLVSFLTVELIHLRHLLSGKSLTREDLHMRADDFLKVPFVQYADPRTYAAEAESLGLRLLEVHRISAMNILEFQRT